MTPRDSGRTAYYRAEQLVFTMFERAPSTRAVQLAGTELTLPVEARFASVQSVREYVARVQAMTTVRERFRRAAVPVTVRPRRGNRKAHYAPAKAEIAIPDAAEGRWALRELVVLHELAHHLDESEGPAHGPGFIETITTLVGLVLGPEAGFVYRVVLADSGVG